MSDIAKTAPQKYRQIASTKFTDFDRAATYRDTFTDTRVRIRRRPDGTFDVVEYEQIKKVA